ncbi:MAG: S8 family serine peptidase [Planctomycetes bacterium]|nr:S8 family serine peptidase [Planctomycetota bacterium]
MSGDCDDIFARIGPEAAWGGGTGRGVKVAIVDSGVDGTHPLLKGRVAGGVVVGEAGERISYMDHDGRDSSGHGTACAGIITRIAPEAEIVSVKVLGTEGATGRTFIAGIAWAIERECQVVNVSIGTTDRRYLEALYELAEIAYYNDAILIAAAENTGRRSFPSTFSSLISVDYDDIRDPLRFLYAPRNRIEFVAPGVNIEAPVPGGGTMLHTGSSFAAPHISGIVALILSKHPGMKPFEVKTVLHTIACHAEEERHGAS